MISSRARDYLIACGCVLLLGAAIPAARAQATGVTRWEYGNGYVRQSRPWVEQNRGGRYTFVETARNALYVELFDASRSYTVRLYDDKLLIRGGNERAKAKYAKFTRLLAGSWEDRAARTEWKYAKGTIKAEEATAWVEKNSHGTFAFTQRQRTAAYVELYDSLRDYTVRFHPDELQIRGGNDSVPTKFPDFTKLYAGRWVAVGGPARATFTVDVDDVPEARGWADAAKKLCEQWYPLIVERLSPNNPPPARKVTILFKRDMKGVAFTNAKISRITINHTWVKAHPEDFGMVIHELTHVVQNYEKGQGKNVDPFWVVEGMADYVRYFEFEPEGPIPLNRKKTYRDGYARAAAFLDWVERSHDARLIVKLNARLREGAYTDDLFREFTGRPLDRLWEDFVAASDREK